MERATFYSSEISKSRSPSHRQGPVCMDLGSGAPG